MAQGNGWLGIFLAATLGLGGVTANAMPARVLILRHAEKPVPETTPDLSERGQQRAQALVGLFTKHPELTTFGLPVAIYAASPKHAGSSMRPIETMTPLAQSLHLQINENFTKDDVEAAVEDMRTNPAYEGKMVVLCWEHETIVDLLPAFGQNNGPHQWPHDEFDRVWKLDFVGESPVGFVDLPQDLLPGDSKAEDALTPDAI